MLLLWLVPADSSSLGAWIRDFFGHQLLLVVSFIVLIVLLVYKSLFERFNLMH
jgi:hypothetical protein